eukprot:5439829-Alexandrium_andersonii.AAC.1
MAPWPTERGCAVGGWNVGLPRPQRPEWHLGLLRGAAQWGVGMSDYLVHSDKNGTLASPEGMRTG